MAIFHFSSYVSLLEEHGITNYKGFTPINYILSPQEWISIYLSHRWLSYSDYVKNFNLPHSAILTQLGVESTTKIPYPHIFDLL
jgi:hypothetical protein